MQLNVREQLIRARARARGNIAIPMDYESLLKKMFGPSRDGKERGPVPTQRRFIESKARWKAFKGMAGVAKTTSLCGSFFLRCLFQPNFQGALGRLDYNDVIRTTFKCFEDMVNRVNPDLIIDRDKTPPLKLFIQQPGGIGIATMDFIGLKDYPGSYEWHRVGVDESDEVDRNVIEGLKSRLRAPCPPEYMGDYGLDHVFNPPDEVHWIYEDCTGMTHDGKKSPRGRIYELFEPTYGENDRNLPDNYQDNFAGMPDDMLQRLKYGNWGTSFPGEPVFKDSFSAAVHLRHDIPFDETLPVFRFWDFGFNRPACIWAQMDEWMRIRLILERLGQNQEAKHFITEVKALSNTNFPLARGYLDFGDPAAKQHKDTGSTLQVLDGQGIELIYLDGMSIEDGLSRCRYIMGQLVKGIPQLLVSKKGCPLTSRMFQGGYRKHPKSLKPLKDGIYDHLADAFRYGITNLYDAEGRPCALPDVDYDKVYGTASTGRDVPDSIEYQD